MLQAQQAGNEKQSIMNNTPRVLLTLYLSRGHGPGKIIIRVEFGIIITLNLFVMQNYYLFLA